MGINFQKKLFSEFSVENSLRFDFNFINSLEPLIEGFYSYRAIFEIIQPLKVNTDDLESFQYAEIGNVSKTGEVSPVFLSFSDRNEENESLFKKIEKGDIILPKKGDILISKIRPYLNKNILIEDEKIYYTKAFIQIRPKIHPLLFYCALRTIFFKKLNAVSRQGKGYPTLKEEDLKSIRFPKTIIDRLKAQEQNILSKIESLLLKIDESKENKIRDADIINHAFGQAFNIPNSDIASIDNTSKLNVKLSCLSLRNNNLRNSFRWNKMQHIQDYLYKNIDCIQLLGSFITETKNGWSPISIEGGDGIPVLGQEHFSYDGALKISPSKFTEETKNNIENYFIQQGDFFVSRGNTVDLVALASVVEEEISEDIIFPDLYIKIQFDETIIDKKYLALLFNSFFGRLYFKYVSKGKNQTMVKISSSELYDFYLPIPDIDVQRRVVNQIQDQIDAQNHIDQKIEENIAKISQIIEEAIRNPVYA